MCDWPLIDLETKVLNTRAQLYSLYGRGLLEKSLLHHVRR